MSERSVHSNTLFINLGAHIHVCTTLSNCLSRIQSFNVTQCFTVIGSILYELSNRNQIRARYKKEETYCRKFGTGANGVC